MQDEINEENKNDEHLRVSHCFYFLYCLNVLASVLYVDQMF